MTDEQLRLLGELLDLAGQHAHHHGLPHAVGDRLDAAAAILPRLAADGDAPT